MSFARQEAPDPARSALRSLRPSLNTPVVVVEDLPAGPASAAIAWLGDPAGPRVVLAIRSERSGQAIFYGPDDEPWQGHGPDVALDAAVSFAESMGFLFEDDRVSQAPDEARRLWADLLDAGGRSRGALPAPPEPDGEEYWLEEIVPPAQAVSHTLPLTKFRRETAAAPRSPADESAAPPAGHPLARFQVGLQRRSP